MVVCLECEAEVTVPDDVQVGDEIACRTCGELFVIVDIDPIEIDYPDDDDWAGEWTEDGAADWDDEDEDDEEDDDAQAKDAHKEDRDGAGAGA